VCLVGLWGLTPSAAANVAGVDEPPYAVVDLDGVVADVRHRLHRLQARPKDWDGFFAAAGDDEVLPEGRAVVEQLVASGHEVVWLTGRPERCRAATLAWLTDNGLVAGPLFMRRDGDRRPARMTKLAVLRELASRRPVAVMVDDDAGVVKAVRAAGFAVMHAEWMATQPTLFDLLNQAQEGDGRT
jgi:phosphoglycolate phosphatase-like HAD superfamily hydrolase